MKENRNLLLPCKKGGKKFLKGKKYKGKKVANIKERRKKKKKKKTYSLSVFYDILKIIKPSL